MNFSPEHRKQFIEAMLAELDHAYTKHGVDPWGRHEFYGVVKEEVDELWDAIKRDEPIENVLKEAMQVACVCLRFAETPDRYKGAHPLPLPSRANPKNDVAAPAAAWCSQCGPPFSDPACGIAHSMLKSQAARKGA